MYRQVVTCEDEQDESGVDIVTEEGMKTIRHVGLAVFSGWTSRGIKQTQCSNQSSRSLKNGYTRRSIGLVLLA